MLGDVLVRPGACSLWGCVSQRGVPGQVFGHHGCEAPIASLGEDKGDIEPNDACAVKMLESETIWTGK